MDIYTHSFFLRMQKIFKKGNWLNQVLGLSCWGSLLLAHNTPLYKDAWAVNTKSLWSPQLFQILPLSSGYSWPSYSTSLNLFPS